MIPIAIISGLIIWLFGGYVDQSKGKQEANP
jgi:hypothetical protein